MATGKVEGKALGLALKAYEEGVRARIQEGLAKLEQYEAVARQKKAQAELATIGGLFASKQDIDRRLQDLKKTNAEFVSRAKADIAADVAKFRASIDQLAAKLPSPRS